MKILAFIFSALLAFFGFEAESPKTIPTEEQPLLEVIEPSATAEEYEALWVNNCIGHLPNSSGKYEKASVTGDSECDCWNRVDGGMSLAKYSGTWYFFTGLDCHGTVGGVNQIQTLPGCNPYDLPCVSDGPEKINIECLHIPNSQGAYTLTPRDQRGQSQCGCWNRDAGGQSFGKIQGKWTFFLQPNCVPAVGEVNLFETATGIDPTVLDCIQEI